MSSAFPRAVQGALAGAVSCLWLTPAFPHAVCGNRIFPATLAIDDPGVGDELALPTISWFPYNSDGSSEWDANFSWTKTITEGLSVVVGSGPTWTHPGGYGWNALDTEIQYQLLCVPDAEFMAKVGFDVSWAATGTGIFAAPGSQNTFSPLVDFGLGMGTLPSAVKILRPFAVTGEFSTTTPGGTHGGQSQRLVLQLGLLAPVQPALFQRQRRRDRQRLLQAPDTRRGGELCNADP